MCHNHSTNVIDSQIQTFKKAGADDFLHKLITIDAPDQILYTFLVKPQKTYNDSSSAKKEEEDDTLKTLQSHFSLLDEQTIHKLMESFK